jgi:CheY-like chemotaxis protein/anti-sigma regulatory factor (Ser/Thr protein kinase)
MQQDAALSPEHRAQVETIGRSGQHLLTLINDVLEISKIEAGKVTLEPRPMDLGELLETIEEMNRLRAEKKGLSLSLAIDPEVPRYVRGDDKKLRQVLVNLLSNAIKFTAHGGIEVRVAPEQGTHRIRFEVVDTGCGIAPEEQQRIFEAFYQTPDASHRGEGTGLGLTISREYAQLMGGRLEVESTVGKGSLFRFAIPLDAVPEGAIETRKQARRVVALEPGQPTYRILIAEDRPESRELLRQLLDAVGFEVRTAENGEKALHLFQSWRPQFVWMDMRMPVMDGYEATRKIKASPEGHTTVVVALTASAFEEDRAEVLATGCDGFLRKPLDVDEIFGAMAEHLGVRYLYAAETAPGAPQAGVDPQAVAAMDPAFRAELARASLLLDVHGARDAIARISSGAPALAEALGRMVDEFRFDELAKLCGSEEPPHPKA